MLQLQSLLYLLYFFNHTALVWKWKKVNDTFRFQFLESITLNFQRIVEYVESAIYNKF